MFRRLKQCLGILCRGAVDGTPPARLAHRSFSRNTSVSTVSLWVLAALAVGILSTSSVRVPVVPSRLSNSAAVFVAAESLPPFGEPRRSHEGVGFHTAGELPPGNVSGASVPDAAPFRPPLTNQGIVVMCALMVMILVMMANVISVLSALVCISAFFTLCGIITVTDLFSGLSNSGMLSIGVLFIIVQPLSSLPLLQRAAGSLLKPMENPPFEWMKTRPFVVPLMKMTALCWITSPFFPNVPHTALLTPIVADACRRQGIHPGLLLMPMTFALAVSNWTPLGSASNLIIAGIMDKHQFRPIGFFEMFWSNGMASLMLMFYFVIAPSHFFSANLNEDDKVGGGKGGKGGNRISVDRFVAVLFVPEGSIFDGKTLREVKKCLTHEVLDDVVLLEIQNIHTDVPDTRPDDDYVLHAMDEIVACGSVKGMRTLRAILHFWWVGVVPDEDDAIVERDLPMGARMSQQSAPLALASNTHHHAYQHHHHHHHHEDVAARALEMSEDEGTPEGYSAQGSFHNPDVLAATVGPSQFASLGAVSGPKAVSFGRSTTPSGSKPHLMPRNASTDSLSHENGARAAPKASSGSFASTPGQTMMSIAPTDTSSTMTAAGGSFNGVNLHVDSHVKGSVSNLQGAALIKADSKKPAVFLSVTLSLTNPCLGTEIRDASFSNLYNCAVLGLHSHGDDIYGTQMLEHILIVGDTLIVRAQQRVAKNLINSMDFFLVEVLEGQNLEQTFHKDYLHVPRWLLYCFPGLEESTRTLDGGMFDDAPAPAATAPASPAKDGHHGGRFAEVAMTSVAESPLPRTKSMHDHNSKKNKVTLARSGRRSSVGPAAWMTSLRTSNQWVYIRLPSWHRNICLLVFGTVVIFAMFGFPLPLVALLGVIFLVMIGTFTVKEAVTYVDWNVYISGSFSFGVGIAMDKSGLAAYIGGKLLDLGIDGVALLLSLHLVTGLVANVVSDRGSIQVMLPVAMTLFKQLGKDITPACVIITNASVGAFLTPYGLTPSLIIAGPGKYKPSDFFMFGWPLFILYATSSAWMTSLYYNFW